jgi:hypothetical protein
VDNIQYKDRTRFCLIRDFCSFPFLNTLFSSKTKTETKTKTKPKTELKPVLNQKAEPMSKHTVDQKPVAADGWLTFRPHENDSISGGQTSVRLSNIQRIEVLNSHTLDVFLINPMDEELLLISDSLGAHWESVAWYRIQTRNAYKAAVYIREATAWDLA